MFKWFKPIDSAAGMEEMRARVEDMLSEGRHIFDAAANAFLGGADPEVIRDDLFAFLDTGAYQEVSASNFNAMPRPAAVLVTGERAAVVRRAETLDDVFRRDELPEHLVPSETLEQGVDWAKRHTEQEAGTC